MVPIPILRLWERPKARSDCVIVKEIAQTTRNHIVFCALGIPFSFHTLVFLPCKDPRISPPKNKRSSVFGAKLEPMTNV
jgi:hypothetical protein